MRIEKLTVFVLTSRTDEWAR